MSRAAARRKVTSAPSSRTRPSVGSSSPAIMRRVVVLPQPEGPSIAKKLPSGMVKFEPCTAVNWSKDLRKFSTRISATALLRKMAHDDEAERAGQDRHKGIAVEVDRPGLHQHENAAGDQGHGEAFPTPAPE